MGYSKLCFTLTSIHYNGYGYSLSAMFRDDFQCFVYSAATCDNIFDNEYRLIGCKLESPAKLELIVNFLCEQEALLKMTGYFLSDDQTTHGGRKHSLAWALA